MTISIYPRKVDERTSDTTLCAFFIATTRLHLSLSRFYTLSTPFQPPPGHRIQKASAGKQDRQAYWDSQPKAGYLRRIADLFQPAMDHPAFAKILPASLLAFIIRSVRGRRAESYSRRISGICVGVCALASKFESSDADSKPIAAPCDLGL